MPKKSKLKDALRAKRFYNNHDLLEHFGGPNSVVVEYTPAPSGRLGYAECDKTTVWRLTRHVLFSDPLFRGQTFHRHFIGKRSVSLPIAKKWAKEIFGHPLVPSPFGGYVTEHVAKSAKAFARAV